MINDNINNTITRIRRMEEIFDVLTAGIREKPLKINEDLLAILIDYYENGEWLHDFEIDEAGFLPSDLKRGVLSEDGVYNLLEEIRETFQTE